VVLMTARNFPPGTSFDHSEVAGGLQPNPASPGWADRVQPRKEATNCLTDQTMERNLLAMFEPETRRLLDAYPAIYAACHRRHIRDDESGAVVTAHQARILDHLDIESPTALGKLAEHLGIGRSAMSIQVSRLADRGYIHRSKVRGDGRRTGLTLTRAGHRIKEQNTVLDPDLVRRLLASMPELERGFALKGIEGLARYAAKLTKRNARSQPR
jgi:DNA-binding MarR family transcriptional regulator